MNTYIYLVRHGQVHNPQGILYGRLPNYGLSETGRRQVALTADFLRDKPITHIYTSPLLRTRQSAHLIQKIIGLDTIHTANKIIEINTSYQGIPFTQLNNIQSEIYLAPKEKTDETVEQIALRMLQFVQYILKHHQGKHIVALSHGDPCMSMRAVIKNWPLTFASMRIHPYIQYAEVWQITVPNLKDMTIKSIFIPRQKDETV